MPTGGRRLRETFRMPLYHRSKSLKVNNQIDSQAREKFPCTEDTCTTHDRSCSPYTYHKSDVCN